MGSERHLHPWRRPHSQPWGRTSPRPAFSLAASHHPVSSHSRRRRPGWPTTQPHGAPRPDLVRPSRRPGRRTRPLLGRARPRGAAEAVATACVSWREANSRCRTCGTRPTAGLLPLRLGTGASPAVRPPRQADGCRGAGRTTHAGLIVQRQAAHTGSTASSGPQHGAYVDPALAPPGLHPWAYAARPPQPGRGSQPCGGAPRRVHPPPARGSSAVVGSLQPSVRKRGTQPGASSWTPDGPRVAPWPACGRRC